MLYLIIGAQERARKKLKKFATLKKMNIKDERNIELLYMFQENHLRELIELMDKIWKSLLGF